MKILRVDMNRERISSEDLPEQWKLIGGSGLIAKVMNREVPPDADPLGPENKLIIACGPLAGTIAPQLGRISVGAKSPLTLGIKEANSGGPAAQKLDRLGIRSIILEGAPEQGKLYCPKISNEEAVLVPADEYRGMKTYELVSSKNFKVINIDSTIFADAPKLSPYREAMQKNIARTIEIEPECVNVKATTLEGLGMIGKGEGIGAMCIALLELCKRNE